MICQLAHRTRQKYTYIMAGFYGVGSVENGTQIFRPSLTQLLQGVK